MTASIRTIRNTKRLTDTIAQYADALPLSTFARDIAEARRYAGIAVNWTARVALPAAIRVACLLGGLLLAGLGLLAVVTFSLIVLAIAALADITVIVARNGWRLASLLAPVVVAGLWRLLAGLVIGAEAIHDTLYRLAGRIVRQTA